MDSSTYMTLSMDEAIISLSDTRYSLAMTFSLSLRYAFSSGVSVTGFPPS